MKGIMMTLSILISLGSFLTAHGASSLGTKPSLKLNFNEMIEGSQQEVTAADGALDKSIRKSKKIRDAQLQRLVRDEINWKADNKALK